MPTQAKPPVFLLDTMSFIFRAYHAMQRSRPMTTRAGVPTAAVFVFVNMIKKLRQDFDPRYFAAVFDMGGEVFRDEQAREMPMLRKWNGKTQSFDEVSYEGYKANRAATPEDLKRQIPYIRRVLEALRIPILEAQGFEADDVIGTLAREAAAEQHEVFIVSGDKDMMQLVTSAVKILNPQKDNLILDPAKVVEVLGVPPERVIDVMALRGDAVDNIPGAPGIGDKGSVDLIQQFGSVEAVLDHAAEVKRKSYRESLEQNRDAVLLSKELVTIDSHVPLTLDLAAMETQQPDLDACRELFAELEFTSMLRDLEPGPADSSPLVEIIENPTEIQAAAFYAAARKGGFAFALDAAAPAMEEEDAAPQSLSLLDLAEAAEKQSNFSVGVCAGPVLAATENGLDLIQSFDENAAGAKAPNDFAAVTARLKSCPDTRQQSLSDTRRESRFDTKHESRSDAKQGLCPDTSDTKQHVETPPKHLSAAGVALCLALTPELRTLLEDAAVPKQTHDWKLALHALAAQDVALRGAVDDTMLLAYAVNPTHAMPPLADVAVSHGQPAPATLAANAAAIHALVPALKTEVKKTGVERVYQDLDLPLAPVLFRMEQAGVRIDLSVLDGLSKRFAIELQRVGERVFSLAGRRFNINSPKQLGEVLFTDLGLPAPARRGKSKAVSTAQNVLEYLAEEHEVPRLVLEYRHLSKLKSTYIDALPLLADAESRVHTTFQEAATATGRLSSVNPNLQNIPVRTELGREIRAAFTAAPGTELLSADYSQIELRLLAHFSGDPLLVRAYQTNEDIHTLTASEVFGVPVEKMDKETRNRAKAVNFGIVYGISAFGLAQQLSIPMGEAQSYIDRYFARYTGVQAFIEKTLEATRKTGSVRTLFGRVRPIPELESRNANQRGFAERTAINTPLQGTAADLIKLAMISIDRQLAERKLKTRMVLQVHDELIFEVPADEKAEVETLVRTEMEGVAKLDVPLVADLAFGTNWRDL